MSPTRRDFLGLSAAAAAGLAFPDPGAASPARPAKPRTGGRGGRRGRSEARPVLISSSNGFRTRHADGRPAIQVGYDMLARGSDPLDAAIAAVQLVELDPTDTSVGLGGLPNADGVVQLDASCMHGPTRRAGAVAGLEDIATPAAVARAVMDRTDHLMLAGAGARRFALEVGFKEQDLMTDATRQAWLRWRSRQNPNDNWLDLPEPGRPAGAGRGPGTGTEPANELDGLLHVEYDEDGIPYTYGTINMNAVTANGDIGSVTTTSGMAWKIPGRIGDSPIIGAGQYCDNDVGAAGSTGRGEANIKVCGAFLAVEFMRQGMAPKDALLKVMQRVIAMTEKRLLDPDGRPYFDLKFYAVNKAGEYAGASAFEAGNFAVCDAKGPRVEDAVFLFKGAMPRKTAVDGAYVRPS